MATIMINALSARAGGGLTYLVNLLKHIDSDFNHKIIILTLRKQLFTGLSPCAYVMSPNLASEKPLLRPLWEMLFLRSVLKKHKVDILFSPNGFLPSRIPGKLKTVTVFQNMLPFSGPILRRYPLGYMRARFLIIKNRQKKDFARTDLLIFISEYARRVIDNAVPSRKGAMVVIPHGIEANFRKVGKSSLMAPLDVEYVLYVSILNYYKMQVEVVKAWAKFLDSGKRPEKLVLLGPENKSYGNLVRKAIQQYHLENMVLIVGPVENKILPAWYQHAKVNIFASLCENCPNILLEALAAGRPVFCSRADPMPEFAGEAAAFFDPEEPDTLASLFARYLDDKEKLAGLASAAEKKSLQYDWRYSAQATWEAVTGLLYAK